MQRVEYFWMRYSDAGPWMIVQCWMPGEEMKPAKSTHTKIVEGPFYTTSELPCTVIWGPHIKRPE